MFSLAGAQAPAPLLQVTEVPGPSGTSFVLGNRYTAAAEEYVIAERSYHPGGQNRCPPQNKDWRGRCVFLTSNSLELPRQWRAGTQDPYAVPPDASVRAGFSMTTTAKLISATNVAVIYADGAMAGAPAILNQLMYQRRRDLTDARQDLVILQRLLANPATDWAQKARMFRRLAQAHSDILAHGPAQAAGALIGAGESDAVCMTVAVQIQPTPQFPASAAGAQFAVRTLEREIAQLQASQPPIDVPSNR